MTKKQVIIRILNRIESNLGEAQLIEECEKNIKKEATDEDELIDSFNGELWLGLGGEADGEAPFMLEAEGEMTENDGVITVSYSSVFSGMAGSKVEYRFEDGNRSFLTVKKTSFFEEVYFFDKVCRRQSVVFDTDALSLELSIYTKSLKNCITFENGGCLEVEYYAELRGGMVEHCKEYVIVEPA